MADLTFDAVVIGGGTKSMVTAVYLAKYGGMSVGVFEERRELCEGMTSEIGVVPGFVADYHASGVDTTWYYKVVQEDFPDFEEKGGKVFQLPGAAGVIAVEDNTCWVIYNINDDPTQEKTAAELARFSCEEDAETYLKLWNVVKPGTDFHISFLQEIYSPPPSPGELSPLQKWYWSYLRSPNCVLDYDWMYASAPVCLQRLFRRPAVVNLFLRRILIQGQFPEFTPGIGVLRWVASIPGAGYVWGGTHNIAHAYQRLLLQHGGRWFPWCKVTKILVENGKAVGIRLEDGTEVRARHLVVSGVSVRQLCEELLGPEILGDKIIRKVRTLVSNIKGIAWYTWFLHEAPRYKAAEFNPDVNRCGGLLLGTDDLRPLMDCEHYLRLGKIPPLFGRMSVGAHTIVDKTRAPEGKHTVIEDADVPTATFLSEREWLEFKIKHVEEALTEWHKYAPNMSWDNVIGFAPQTPYDAANRGTSFWPDGNAGVIDVYPGQIGPTAPFVEFAQYRTPVKNLYATGGWRPVSGANCTQGYVCYKVIAEDLGLRKPWEEKGRSY